MTLRSITSRVTHGFMIGLCATLALLGNGDAVQASTTEGRQEELIERNAHQEAIDRLMHAWALVGLVRAISYRDAHVFNEELFERLLTAYRAVNEAGVAHKSAGLCSDATEQQDVMLDVAERLCGGVTTICDVQAPEASWPLIKIAEHILSIVTASAKNSTQ